MSNMEITECIVAQVERFERYCLKKRHLEGDIESVLARMDKDVVEVVERAECELENTKLECAEIEARIERACRGDFDLADNFRESGRQVPPNAMKEGEVLQPRGSNTQLANVAPNEPVQPRSGVDEPSSAASPPILSSMPTSAADSDDFSVVSNPQREATGTSYNQEGIINTSGHSEDASSDEFLTLLVQRYTDICYERRTLREEIENRLERKERMASERLTCAKIALEATRQKAVEIVAALNEASGGGAMVNLPAGVSDSVDSKPIRPTAGGAYASRSVSTVPLVPAFVLVKAHKHATPIPPSKETPFPACSELFPDPDAIPSSTAEHLSQPISRGIPALPTFTPLSASAPNFTPLSASAPTFTPLPTSALLPQHSITTTQQAIFKKYDAVMTAAKAAGSGLSMQNAPWPLFTPHQNDYPVKNIGASQLMDSRVKVFIEGYVRWKGWDIKVEGKSVLADWEELHSKVPERKPGGKACMQRVTSILRALVKS